MIQKEKKHIDFLVSKSKEKEICWLSFLLNPTISYFTNYPRSVRHEPNTNRRQIMLKDINKVHTSNSVF